MILESIDEIRRQGVTVYPHVVEPKAQPLDVSRFTLSPWARWVAMIDDTGEVWEFEQRPFYRLGETEWTWPPRAQAQCIGTIDPTGIDWRETLTAVNQTQHSDWMEAHIATEVAAIDAAPPAQPIPADVAATLLATYSRSWCVRLMEDMARLLGNDDGAVVWWLAQMTPAALESVAQQLASGNAETAYILATRLESKLYTKVPHDVHIAQLLAAHQPAELEAVAQQLATADVVRADALRLALDAAVSARFMADMQGAPMQADVAEARRLVDLPYAVMMAGTATECVEE